ncbi:hypothetical protein NDA12_004019 [Ustilago hordei]|nr:hypothetical protein NDA15_006999 [Ustilago hordei]KAJ1590094.1 hypothetical protein NDA12_004019 [Ustilago hordei]
MSKVNYSIYNSFIVTVQNLLPQLPRMVQDHFNQVMEDEVYGMPNAPKDGQLLKYIIDNDEEQMISPLTILVKCISALYKGTHSLGLFANQIELEHGDQLMPITVDLFDWAVDKCKKHLATREYELLSAAYAFRWDQVSSNAYDFLIKWEALVSELHAYLHEPWTPDHRYRMLKRALPSDKNALFNSIFILHEQLHGREETMESVAHVLCQCYELTANSTSVSMHNMTEESELIMLQATTLINCWACSNIGHAANRCLNDTAHARWKESKIKAVPKGWANTCIVLPLTDMQEE